MTKANSLSRWLAAAMAALMLLALLPARVWAAESTAYDTDGATAFTFTDSAITAKDGDCTGYDIDGTALTIEAAGTYIVSGSCQSGSITVKKGVTGVTLVLSGDLTIDAGDDAVHSDYYLTVGAAGAAGTDGPTITINSCYEGLEAADLSVASGNIVIHASDDCLNAANSDLTGYAFTLSISGGTLVMDTTSGDGIDSNGTLSISGGTVVVWTNNTADNQPLDAGGAISITGGTTPPQLPSGSDSSSDSRPTPPSGSDGSQPTPPDGSDETTPPELPDGQTAPDGSSDNQPGGQFPGQTDGQSVSISQGSTFTIQSSDGTAVYTGEAVYDARFVFFSSAAMTSGETYTLTSGGTELATATAGGTGTAAVTTPDTSADTADTPQTSDSHTALYIALGTVAVLGAAAVVVVVLRKQKKA